jgi:hypothetical protein
MKERGSLKDLNVDGSIIQKLFFNKKENEHVEWTYLGNDIVT